ncbi:sensor histidine kinase [Anaerolineae bacterium CFX4]|nr:sensor histidine kinase [Anaerolineae bacterium CFX4]
MNNRPVTRTLMACDSEGRPGMTGQAKASVAQRVWDVVGAVSIRVKVLGIVLGVILVLGVFVIVQMRYVLDGALTGGLEEQGIALANSIARDAGALLTADDLTALRMLLAERRAHYSSESHNTLVDYLIVQSADGSEIVRDGRAASSAGAIPRDHGGFHGVYAVNGGRTIEIRSVIAQNGGLLRLGLSRDIIMQTVDRVTVQLLAITAVMVAVGFAAAFFLTWILTRPVLELVSATHAVAKGDFSPRVERWADDEIGELASAFNHMTESLAQAERERIDRDRLREQYISGVIGAQENERQRIARELHDSTSQSLTLLLVGLQNVKQTDDLVSVRTQVDDLRGVIANTLDEIRDISWRLRPRALDDLGLASAIRNYVQDYQRRHGIPVEAVISGLEGRLALEQETAVYRIVQEGLTNIARYAQANAVSLIVTRKAGRLKIIIEDDGVGFDPDEVARRRVSLGLHGIRERAALFGGTLTIESTPGQGTSLFIEMPVTETAEEHA